MIFFNWIGAAFCVIGIAVAIGLGQTLGISGEGFVLVISGLIVIPLDLLYRVKSEDGHLLHPFGGGNLCFIPVWCCGILWLIYGLITIVKGIGG